MCVCVVVVLMAAVINAECDWVHIMSDLYLSCIQAAPCIIHTPSFVCVCCATGHNGERSTPLGLKPNQLQPPPALAPGSQQNATPLHPPNGDLLSPPPNNGLPPGPHTMLDNMQPLPPGPAGPMPPQQQQQALPPPPGTLAAMEAGFMQQQQSQIFVFSTALANEGAKACQAGMYKSILDFHMDQPRTKQLLQVRHGQVVHTHKHTDTQTDTHPPTHTPHCY